MKIHGKIDSVEYSFELDSEELRSAFEEFRHLGWLQDAERQLLATFDDMPEWVEDVSEEDRQAFLQAYGFSIENAVDPESTNYILDTLVARYQSALNCNDSENTIWGERNRSISARNSSVIASGGEEV